VSGADALGADGPTPAADGAAPATDGAGPAADPPGGPDLGIGESGLGSPLQPLRLRNAGEQIADRLVTAIALGEFVPGQRLPTERDLAALLGVSRTSVREAIHRLAAGGYVTVQRGRNGGAVVQAGWGPTAAEMIRRTLLPNWAHFEWLFDLRGLIEPLIARTAAERRERADVTALELALDDYRAATDREASRAADQAVHDAVARATHNPYLVRISRQMRVQISLGFGAEPYSPAIRSRAVTEHAALVVAVCGGDAESAARLAAEHITLTESSVRALRRRIEAGGGEVAG
jgi:GntR family transcriptional regulator, transcriptional repressor for pyruvate dehydrogenase complex